MLVVPKEDGEGFHRVNWPMSYSPTTPKQTSNVYYELALVQDVVNQTTSAKGSAVCNSPTAIFEGFLLIRLTPSNRSWAAFKKHH